MEGSIAYSSDNVTKMGKIVINGEVRNEKSSLFIEPTKSLAIEVNI